MDIRKKFTFDDPEDSYWNQSASTSASIFEDPKDVANEARHALALLTESREQFSGTATAQSDETSSIAESEKPLSEVEFVSKFSASSTPAKRVDVPLQSFNESSSSFGDERIYGMHKAPFSTASIVSEGSIGSFNSEATVYLDFSRLKSEHKKLQKHLEHVRSERYRAPSIAETIKRLRNCEPVILDFYRSREQKVELLDAAMDTLDHDVIIRVILFLKSTLTNRIFREILLFKPEAANAYMSYLKESGEFEELIESLFSLGRSHEAAMLEFSIACKKRQSEAKVQALKKCLVSGFSDPSLSHEAGHIRDYINLLETQIPNFQRSAQK
ncbi:hypothetical protein FO519_004183 [Halicephalobus sp. NKZ332]|nr:hypothetical protein FO519_004183 [Halicephalobus sp. NKZ332]